MSKTPYSNLPDSAYWRRSVAAIPADDVDPVPKPPFQLAPRDKVMTAGSCFAQHIARYLGQSGFSPMMTEPPHPVFSTAEAEAFNYGTFTARYGNIYVPRQLLQLFRRAYGRFQPKEDIWTAPAGHFIDPFRPQIQPGGFASRKEYDLDRKQHFAAVRQAFETLDVFVFTLGLTEGWVSLEDGAVFPLCPGVAGGQFDPKRHAFHNFTVAEIVTDLTDFLAELRQINPKCRVVLTVSPVPLIATASDNHVLTATTLSKSILRIACDQLEQQEDNLFYFPSYEIITGAHNQGRFFAADLRSVTEDGVAKVMELFFRHLTKVQPKRARPSAPVAKVDAHQAAMEQVVKVACDEEILDAGLGQAQPTAASVMGRIVARLRR